MASVAGFAKRSCKDCKHMRHLEKYFATIVITMMLCQYYGFYLFAGWRGVVCALVNMILYGLIAFMFSKAADANHELAENYKMKMQNAINQRDNFENELYNAKQILYIHGLGKNPVNE